VTPTEDPTTSPTRLFVAVRPTEPATTALRALPRDEQPGVRWSAPENWHVTLRFLGDASMPEVIAALSSMPLPSPRTVALGPMITLLGNAIVVRADGLDEVANQVAVATSAWGTVDEGRPFLGHLTLGRLRRANTSCRLLGRPFRSTFTLDAIELLASEQRNGKTWYRPAHRWPI